MSTKWHGSAPSLKSGQHYLSTSSSPSRHCADQSAYSDASARHQPSASAESGIGEADRTLGPAPKVVRLIRSGIGISKGLNPWKSKSFGVVRVFRPHEVDVSEEVFVLVHDMANKSRMRLLPYLRRYLEECCPFTTSGDHADTLSFESKRTAPSA
jgi:hypothetical protein